jgi:hypothetical protein
MLAEFQIQLRIKLEEISLLLMRLLPQKMPTRSEKLLRDLRTHQWRLERLFIHNHNQVEINNNNNHPKDNNKIKKEKENKKKEKRSNDCF